MWWIPCKTLISYIYQMTRKLKIHSPVAIMLMVIYYYYFFSVLLSTHFASISIKICFFFLTRSLFFTQFTYTIIRNLYVCEMHIRLFFSVLHPTPFVPFRFIWFAFYIPLGLHTQSPYREQILYHYCLIHVTRTFAPVRAYV